MPNFNVLKVFFHSFLNVLLSSVVMMVCVYRQPVAGTVSAFWIYIEHPAMCRLHARQNVDEQHPASTVGRQYQDRPTTDQRFAISRVLSLSAPRRQLAGCVGC